MEENIIQRYVFPNNKETIFRSCDFHLVGEKENCPFVIVNSTDHAV